MAYDIDLFRLLEEKFENAALLFDDEDFRLDTSLVLTKTD